MTFNQKVEVILAPHQKVFDNVKKNSFYIKINLWTMLGSVIGFFTFFALYIAKLENEGSQTFIYLAIPFAVTWFATFVILMVLWIKRIKLSFAIHKAIGIDGNIDELYSLYFNENFAQTNLTFVKTKFLDGQTAAIYFLENKTTPISFIINYTSRTVTKKDSNGKETQETVYDIYYKYERALTNFQNYKEISIRGNKISHKKSKVNDSSFQTESINFNQHFIVKTKDEMTYRRFLTPTMIEKFLAADFRFCQLNVIKVKDAQLCVNGETIGAASPYNMLLDVNFGPTIKKSQENMARSIKKDFDFFLSYYEATKFLN